MHITIAWQGVRVDVGFEGRNVVVGGFGRLGNTANVDRFDCNYRLSLSIEIQRLYIFVC